jgi:sarcosine oxidase
MYHAIIAGLGAAGSAAAYHLARRGRRVLGLDRFGVPNEMGSSHGLTRIIRLAYYEHPSYVPLLLRAYDLWEALERDAGERLLVITGSIDASAPGTGGEVFEESRRSCEIYSLPHEVLTGAGLARRFPAYHLPADTLALLQPRGGFLLPERCIAAHAALAARHGAELRTDEGVEGWETTPDGVRVHTRRGSYEAERLVIAVGSWTGKLVPSLAPLLVPERQVLAWLDVSRPEHFAPERMPVFNLTVEEGRFYGFPEYGVRGFKLGRYHHLGEVADPDHVDRVVHDRDVAVLRDFARRYFPDGAGEPRSTAVCLFTNTPDEHFIIDRLPDYEDVIVCSSCSGHGFKFASVVGEIVADLAERDGTGHDIEFLRLSRFRRPGGSTGVGPG